MTFFKTISLAGVLALTTTAASASSWTISDSIGIVPGGGFERVVLENTLGLSPGAGTNDDGTAATAFSVEAESSGDPSITESFLAWCLDFTTSFFGGDRIWEQSATLNTATLPSGSVASGAQDRIQSLFDSTFDTAQTIEAQLGTGPDGRLESAAFQLALWEVVFDDDWSVTDPDGTFWASDDTAGGAVITRADALLSEASTYSGGKGWNLSFYSSENRQDVITASPIPLPAAGWLLLAGIGALGALARRRKATA